MRVREHVPNITEWRPLHLNAQWSLRQQKLQLLSQVALTNCDIFNSQLDFFMLSVTLLQGHRYQSGRDTLWCVYGCFYKFVFGREWQRKKMIFIIVKYF